MEMLSEINFSTIICEYIKHISLWSQEVVRWKRNSKSRQPVVHKTKGSHYLVSAIQEQQSEGGRLRWKGGISGVRDAGAYNGAS